MDNTEGKRGKNKKLYALNKLVALKLNNLSELRKSYWTSFVVIELINLEEALLKLFARIYLELEKSDTKINLLNTVISLESILFILNINPVFNAAVQSKCKLDCIFKKDVKKFYKLALNKVNNLELERVSTTLRIIRFHFYFYKKNLDAGVCPIKLTNIYQSQQEENKIEQPYDWNCLMEVNKIEIGNEDQIEIKAQTNLVLNSSSSFHEKKLSDTKSVNTSNSTYNINNHSLKKGCIFKKKSCVVCKELTNIFIRCHYCGLVVHEECVKNIPRCSILEHSDRQHNTLKSANSDSYEPVLQSRYLSNTVPSTIRSDLYSDSKSEIFVSINEKRSSVESNSKWKRRLQKNSLCNSYKNNELFSNDDRESNLIEGDMQADKQNGQIKTEAWTVENGIVKGRQSKFNDWVIPSFKIEKKSFIRYGRFGQVIKASWHGDLTMTIIDKNEACNDSFLDFKYRINMIRKTRHENLILFMGIIINPPMFAILTDLEVGQTLYDLINKKHHSFTPEMSVIIMNQVARGISYMHSKEILHNYLSLKTIYLYKNKVKLVDYGLVSIQNQRCFIKLDKNRLLLNKYWTYYQAPEVLKVINPIKHGEEVRYYSQQSDVYAFGITWYELITQDVPFKNNDLSVFIYCICSRKNVRYPKVFIPLKIFEILVDCLNPRVRNRGNMKEILYKIMDLPKTFTVARAPSQPILSKKKQRSHHTEMIYKFHP